jgi:hypothetical protein
LGRGTHIAESGRSVQAITLLEKIMTFGKRWQLLVLGSALVLAACMEQPLGVDSARPQLNVVGEPAYVLLKKHGPAGTYQFQFDATTGSLPVGSSAAITAGEWVQVWKATSAAEPTAPFTITELLGTGMQVDSIYILTLVRDANGFLAEGVQTKLTGTNVATLDVSIDLGAYVLVYNSVRPPSGGQGCTPGYWKQAQHFGSWTAPYAPATAFGSVFANAFPGKSLLQILETNSGGLNALGRHSVAALLNAASADVDSGLSAQDVIDAFNAAFASGDYETQKNIFEQMNEQGCPLGLAP